MMHTDFIIVGQGLGGSVLALKLIEQGYSVKVIDKPEMSSCSKAAAGIWNPVVFKRLTKSWMIDELLPELLQFYKQTEKLFNASLITEREIIKIFSEQQEADLWKKKAEEELKNYLDKTIYSNEIAGIKNSAYGYSKVLQAGNLDVKKFLQLTKQFLMEKESSIEEKFNYDELIVSETISYKDIKAKNIMFADGYLIRNNPFFNYVPFKPAKGEVLTINSKTLNIGSSIINKNSFLMQLEKDTYKFGATYDWNNLNDNTSSDALSDLEKRFSKMAEADHIVTGHEAGVRPSVVDRRPVLGSHPIYQNMFVFNGFGTKGVMLAPYFAQKLMNFIKFKEPLNDEVNVSRFNKFFVN
jgi:glycine oxidase